MRHSVCHHIIKSLSGIQSKARMPVFSVRPFHRYLSDRLCTLAYPNTQVNINLYRGHRSMSHISPSCSVSPFSCLAIPFTPSLWALSVGSHRPEGLEGNTPVCKERERERESEVCWEEFGGTTEDNE